MVARILAVLLCGLLLTGQQRPITDAEVRRIHDATLLIDTHNDVPWRMVDGFDIGPRSNHLHTDIPRLKEGGVGAVFFVAYTARWR
jgi:membrane dipeptidase